MVDLKRAIATLIVCFKPHIFLTLCILIVLVHSMIVVLQRSTKAIIPHSRNNDITKAINYTVLTITVMFASFFYFIVKFELRNELEALLVFFQCSRRGLRFLGVVVFHILMLAVVILMVSSTVEKSITGQATNQTKEHQKDWDYASLTTSQPISRVREVKELSDQEYYKLVAREASLRKQQANLRNMANESEKAYMSLIYKIWFTAIFYAFLYLMIENTVMFYADMTLIEFVHSLFLAMVAKLTGIDLSDYSGGEMLFNPLMSRRIR